MMLPVSKLYSIDDRMINEYGEVEILGERGPKYWEKSRPSATFSTT
jgi:hypothetical protein